MLNISPENSISLNINSADYDSFGQILETKADKRLTRLIWITFAIGVIILFLPWTQNIRANGKTLPLLPGERPQTVNATLDGRIETWFVQEGDTVQAGDTLLYFSEVKDAYWDPDLILRTEDQFSAKQQAMQAYEAKAQALASQVNALDQTLRIKLQEASHKIVQTKLKVQADSMKVEAAQTAYEIALEQFQRWDTLYQQSLKSKTAWEDKRNKLRLTEAKIREAINDLAARRQELGNVTLRRAKPQQ